MNWLGRDDFALSGKQADEGLGVLVIERAMELWNASSDAINLDDVDAEVPELFIDGNDGPI